MAILTTAVPITLLIFIDLIGIPIGREVRITTQEAKAVPNAGRHMTHWIEIKDGDSQTLQVKPTDILEHFPLEASRLRWSLLALWAMGTLDMGYTMADLIARVEGSLHGVDMTWSELTRLVSQFDQEIDVLLVGRPESVSIRADDDERALFRECVFVLELVDGDSWRVYSKDAAVTNRLLGTFSDVETLDHLLNSPANPASKE